MWVITPRIERVLGGFYNKVTRRLMGRQPRRVRDGVWIYPPLEDAMAEAEMYEVETYISRHQNTVS